MSYYLELRGIKYRNLEDFKKNICGKCRWKPICWEYEWRYGVRLARKIGDMIRCPRYEELGEIRPTPNKKIWELSRASSRSAST